MKNNCSNYSANEIIGHSQHLQYIRKQITDAARIKKTVLIEGDRGTGKELIAQNIHSQSDSIRFFPVNCGAISSDLFESEFFGHVKEAFTGATQDKKGLVEEANGGTLFLDEIGNLRKDHQGKLLRFLQDKSYRAVGSLKDKSSNVRIIAATNKNLEKEINNEKFFADLYDRLRQYVIRIPPLRDRPEDSICLVHHFIERDELEVDEKVKFLLYSYDLPGNVRDIENLLQYDYEYVSDELIRSWASSRKEQPEKYLRLSSLNDVQQLIDKGDDRFIEAPYYLNDLAENSENSEYVKKLVNEIVQAYEIITLKFTTTLNMEEMAKLLSIRKEKLSAKKFRDYFGFEFPEINDRLCAELIGKRLYPHFVDFMGKKRAALMGPSSSKV